MLEEPQSTVALLLSEQFPVKMCLTLTKVISATVYSETFAFLPDPLGLICCFSLSQEVTIDSFFQCEVKAKQYTSGRKDGIPWSCVPQSPLGGEKVGSSQGCQGSPSGGTGLTGSA